MAGFRSGNVIGLFEIVSFSSLLFLFSSSSLGLPMIDKYFGNIHKDIRHDRGDILL